MLCSVEDNECRPFHFFVQTDDIFLDNWWPNNARMKDGNGRGKKPRLLRIPSSVADRTLGSLPARPAVASTSARALVSPL